ncbi:PIN domain-containing protein [Methanoculleus sp.]|uniref:PIN domain-containing protein n=1 Tax=Methanoculleus sp. TaxID=90427 RepID=UPI0025EF818C|nr:PIN domain-containing protein [Methanoculleus sp.]
MKSLRCSVDANCIFDLDAGGILDCPSRLGYTFLMANFIAHEIKTVSQERLRRCGLEIVDLEPGQVSEIYELLRRHRGLSHRDLSAFVLARDSRSVLVTGDGRLRTMAEENGVECHGTLWILDALVDGGILKGARAADAVRSMQANGRWLPKAECDTRIRVWGP